MKQQSHGRLVLARALGNVERAREDSLIDLPPTLTGVAEIPDPISGAIQTEVTPAPVPITSSIFLSDGQSLNGPQAAFDRLIGLFTAGVWQLSVIKVFDFIGTTNDARRSSLDLVTRPDAAGAGAEFLIMGDFYYTGTHRDKFLSLPLTFSAPWALRHVIDPIIAGDNMRDQLTIAALRLF